MDAHNADPQALRLSQQPRTQTLEYRASNETHLTVGMIPRRSFAAAGARLAAATSTPNLPTEECLSRRKRGEAEGIVYSSKPLSYQGQLIEDFSIRFEHGRSVEVHARTNEALLQKLIAMDDGAAYLGECAQPYDVLSTRRASCFITPL